MAATGGSTNAALHLPAIAHEAGIRFTLDNVAEVFQRTPLIANLRPGGVYHAKDVYDIGGVPVILKELLGAGLIHGDCLTVDGRCLSGSLSDVWKNNFFRSKIPLGLFNYGGIVAVQTLWAGPWMVRVAGYTPLESATGLFWINVTMLFAFFVFGYILPKITKLGIESIKLIKLGLPISYLSLLVIIILGENAGALHFTIYILTSIFLTLTQPAVALSFPTSIAGKSLTSFNLLIFVGTFIMQWGIGLIIDFCKFLGKEEVQSFKISFTVYLIICILSYLYFLMKNKNE